MTHLLETMFQWIHCNKNDEVQSFYYLDDDCGDNLSNCEDDMSYIGANNSSDFTVDDFPKTKFDLDLETETFGADSVTEETENL